MEISETRRIELALNRMDIQLNRFRRSSISEEELLNMKKNIVLVASASLCNHPVVQSLNNEVTKCDKCEFAKFRNLRTATNETYSICKLKSCIKGKEV